jgi:hypothetical protein
MTAETPTDQPPSTPAVPVRVAAERLMRILMPRLSAARDAFRESNRCFVHYTTGANAQAILQSRTMWMRSTVCMNDYSEVQHGHNLLLSSFHGNGGALRTRFIAALEAVHVGVAEAALNAFDGYIQANMYRVFVTCLSEHDPTNHASGRLSMWRAYGAGETPVALVLNKDGFFTESDSANLFLSPVAYMGDTEAVQLIETIVINIESNRDFLASLPYDLVMRSIFVMLLFTCICVKHPGFSEEQEWRLVYLPSFARSEMIHEGIESVRAVPQHIYKIPLQNRPDLGLNSIEIPQLLQSIIIGPTSFPFPVSEAFRALLIKCGVPNAHEKVKLAMIPLRT